MDARTFRNQVLMMAEEAGIKFLLIAEGEIAQRGTMEEIINSTNNTINKPYTSALVKGATKTYEDLFKLIDNIPSEPGEALYLNSNDIADFRVSSCNEYSITVAGDRDSIMIIAGNIDDGMPLISITKMGSGEVNISPMSEIPNPDNEDEMLVVGTSSVIIPMSTMVQGSLAGNPDLPSHIANELETFMIATIRVS